MDLDEFDAEMDRRVQAFTDTRFASVEHAPNFLWHYTGAPGFMGIVDRQKIWATHVRFMNDPGEGEHTFDVLTEAVRGSVVSDECDGVLKFLRHAINTHRAGSYLACFSSNGDLLSQWRAYGNDGLGFAVGIDLRVVPEGKEIGLAGRAPFGPILARVIYDHEEKREALAEVVDTYQMTTSPPERRADQRFKTIAVNAALRMLNICALAFKSPAYQEEEEWRLVWVGLFGPRPQHLRSSRLCRDLGEQQFTAPIDDVPLQFRMTAYGFAPYLDWPITASQAIGAPLRGVRLGPKHSDESARSVETFLAWRGFADIEVTRSAATYR